MAIRRRIGRALGKLPLPGSAVGTADVARSGEHQSSSLNWWAALEARRSFLRRSAGVVVGAAIATLEAACGGKRPSVPSASTTTAPTVTAVPSPTIVPAAALHPRQPNVILITVDTLRADRIGVYGFARAHTPTLDQFAREGVRFAKAICQLPQTNASHASLLTGLYASTNGVKVHMVDKLAPGSQTMATIFRANGYRTAGIYSWVSLDPQFCGLNQGFDTYAGYVLNRPLLLSDPRLEQLAAVYREVKAKLPVVKTADLVLGSSQQIEETVDGRADVTNQAVFQWLEAHATGDPFFLWIHYFDPHYPYAPPNGYDHVLGVSYNGKIDGSVQTIHEIESGKLTATNADRARLDELYQGEIAYTDAQLGRLFVELERRGLKDDTAIVIAADHGESFGEHGDWTHGLKVYETEIHVPLLIRYPARIPAGLEVAGPVQLIDVLPTLLDLTGLKASKQLQGASLLPLIQQPDANAQRLAFTELADEAFVSMLTRDWKVIRNNANGELQLYHVSNDEAEQKNLAQAEASVARDLNARLQDVMKIAGVSHQ